MSFNEAEYKLATTIWVLSCSDKLPQMTYKSLEFRVDGITEKDCQRLIEKFPELYRKSIPKKQFETWKSKMKKGESRPHWIAISGDQESKINNLQREDVFRNRFRNSLNAAVTSAEILAWGLAYIKDHYSLKTAAESRRWNRIATTVVPALSILVAGLSIWFSAESSNNQLAFENKKFERELIVPNYNRLVEGLSNSYLLGGMKADPQTVLDEVSKARSSLMALSPFLEESTYQRLNHQLTTYSLNLLSRYSPNDSTRNDSVAEYYTQVSTLISEAIREKIDEAAE